MQPIFEGGSHDAEFAALTHKLRQCNLHGMPVAADAAMVEAMNDKEATLILILFMRTFYTFELSNSYFQSFIFKTCLLTIGRRH